MLKSIKVEEAVYNKLDELRGKRETFSQVVGRLIVIKEGIAGLVNVLEGNKAYAEYTAKKLETPGPAAPAQNSG